MPLTTEVLVHVKGKKWKDNKIYKTNWSIIISPSICFTDIDQWIIDTRVTYYVFPQNGWFANFFKSSILTRLCYKIIMYEKLLEMTLSRSEYMMIWSKIYKIFDIFFISARI